MCACFFISLCSNCGIVQLLFDGDDILLESPVGMDLFLDLFISRHDRGVVAPTEDFADLGEGDLYLFPQKVHGDLPR